MLLSEGREPGGVGCSDLANTPAWPSVRPCYQTLATSTDFSISEHRIFAPFPALLGAKVKTEVGQRWIQGLPPRPFG